MNIQLVIFFMGVFFLASIPFEKLIPYLYDKIKAVDDKLIKDRASFYISKAPLVYFLSLLLTFLKGFLPLYIYRIFFYDSDLMIAILCLGILIFHNWNVWAKFQNKQKFNVILVGIYFSIDPSLGMIFILFYLGISLLLNSFLLGILFSVVGMFAILWYLPILPVFFLINLGFFIIMGIAFKENLYKHFNGQTFNIYKAFSER